MTGRYYSPGVTEITQSNFRNIITLIDAIEISESCESLTNALLCAYTFPACDFNTSQLLPICPQRCELIDEIFGTCRQFVSNDTLQLIPVLRPLLETFNCSNPLTYFNVPPQYISETLCSNLGKLWSAQNVCIQPCTGMLYIAATVARCTYNTCNIVLIDYYNYVMWFYINVVDDNFLTLPRLADDNDNNNSGLYM